jgi:hypothetical protein
MTNSDKASNVFANEQKRTRMAELDVVLEAQIMEYNNMATELGVDIIVAYKMTHDDLDDMIKEVYKDEQPES